VRSSIFVCHLERDRRLNIEHHGTSSGETTNGSEMQTVGPTLRRWTKLYYVIMRNRTCLEIRNPTRDFVAEELVRLRRQSRSQRLV